MLPKEKKMQSHSLRLYRYRIRGLVYIPVMWVLLGGYVFGQGTDPAPIREYHVVDIITSKKADATVQRNIFIDRGSTNGAKAGDLLRVLRIKKTHSGTPYRVRIGKVQIAETFNEVSKATMIENEPDSILSSLKYKTVMVGDLCIPIYYRKLIIHFQKSSFDLNPDDSQAIESISTLLQSYKNFDILIEGHTDNEGDAQYNVNLSLDRANAIKNILVSLGIPALAIKTIGHGDRYPVEPNTTEMGRMQNRRVELTVTAEY